MKKLARAGTVAADMLVPCLVLADNDNPTEISLAENQLREAMHPDNQCAAFQTLIGDGMPVEDIAARFGVNPAVVRQRLRLADTAGCTAHAAMAAEVDRWHDRIPADTAALWDWLLAQDTETLLDMLATFAAETLDAVTGTWHGANIRHADQLAAALDLDMATCWQPTPRFMGRLSKKVMAGALTEAGHATVAADLAVMKKSAAAAKAAQVLAGTGWLPPVLRRPEAAAVNDNVPVAPWEDDDAEMHEAAA